MNPPAFERNLPRTTPMKYLAVMAALMVASAWLAAGDRRTRDADESHVLPTALGDRRWLTEAGDSLPLDRLGHPLAYYNGSPLFPRTRKTREFRPETMERVSETDDGAYGLFRPAAKAGEAGKTEAAEAEALYLMVGQVSDNPGRGIFREVGEQKYRAPGQTPPPAP